MCSLAVETPGTQESFVFNFRRVSKMSQCGNMGSDLSHCLIIAPYISLKWLLKVFKKCLQSIAIRCEVGRSHFLFEGFGFWGFFCLFCLFFVFFGPQTFLSRGVFFFLLPSLFLFNVCLIFLRKVKAAERSSIIFSCPSPPLPLHSPRLGDTCPAL